ncbi:MAG: hypothetical protein WEC79_04535 [Thermomicrobiales bacterium]
MGQARVLLVDDDQLFIRRMRQALAGSMDLQVATTSCDALSTEAGWTPDVVVIDPLLGDTDSFGLLDRLRERWRESGVGVICLSRGPGAVTRYQPEAGGFYGAVMRDVGVDGVCDAVRYAVSDQTHASELAV